MLDRNKVRDVPSRAHRRSVAWLGRDDQRLAETFRKGPANLAGIHAGKAYAVERAGLNWHERYELEDGGARNLASGRPLARGFQGFARP
jgi:hypothetical protein